MALPDFAEAGPAQTYINDPNAGTLTAWFQCTMVHNNAAVTIGIVRTAPFLASGGIAAENAAVIDACVQAFSDNFGGAVLARNRVVYIPKALGS